MSKLSMTARTAGAKPHNLLSWPVPALLTWAAAWLVYKWMEPNLMAPAAAMLPAGVMVWRTPGFTRRLLLLAGFPLSLMLLDASQWPAWLWLLPAGVLLMIYPVKAWRDAPLFPTHVQALRHLDSHLRLPATAKVLDAGCGLGHGLQALAAQWPQAQLHGIEHSWPLTFVARLRCPQAVIQRGDMWQRSWAGFDLVYLFQRPESMDRAWVKACTQMKPDTWLVSLEFAVAGRTPDFSIQRPGERPVWAYRIPGPNPRQAQPVQPQADKPVESTASCAVS
jgi:hypothetical protein